MNKLEQLIAKLEELFELDKADLDFGIHRIIKSKHKQIQEYLNARLPHKVKSVLDELKSAQENTRLETVKQQLKEEFGNRAFDDDGNLVKEDAKASEYGVEYQQLIDESKDAVNIDRIENEVYSHLYEFFSRYYEEGDFISQRRHSNRSKYAIPYNGEEVVLHWANKDQYYIKSSEDMKDYIFTLKEDDNEKRVKFKLTNMDHVENNNKAHRSFVLDEEREIEVNEDSLIIPFHFKIFDRKPTQKQLVENLVNSLDEKLPDDWKEILWKEDITYTGKDTRTIIEKHLQNYTKKNTSDYFIHKDLGGFLRNELDFYIKNEVMYLDDVDDRPANYLEDELRKIKAIRKVAKDLIDFLAQFEDFQKKLWLKKKFVIETNYCITLDKMPEEFYEEIAANDAQREEWVKLFAIDEIEGNIVDNEYSVPLTLEFLMNNKNLVLDTKFFTPDFKIKLIARIQDLNDQCDGLLVDSDNFQALNLFDEFYKERVNCIYIDPPYNTGPSEILYKNNYKNSSWLTFMRDRLNAAKKLSNNKTLIAVAIDDYALIHLGEMIDELFVDYDREMIIVNHHPQGSGGKNISRTHEYMMILVPKGMDVLKGKEKTGEIEYRSFMLSGPGDNKSIEGRPNSFYAILVNEDQNKIVGFEKPPKSTEEYPIGETQDGYKRIYPIGSSGREQVWCRSYESAKSALENGEITITTSSKIKLVVNTEGKRSPLFSNWVNSKYNAGPHGTRLIYDILGDSELFSYPKSIHVLKDTLESMTYYLDEPIIMDYFAGSGTTGHAIIDFYREGIRKKYILVEMEDYFESVLKQRIQKVIYANDWGSGKPNNRLSGVSHFLKYQKLESYDDALNNLAFEPKETDLIGIDEEVQEEYLLKYMLDVESRSTLLNLERFEDPFNYQLKIYNKDTGEAEPRNVDLPETFNYLIGLMVREMQMKEGFLLIEGENPQGETVLVIWRNVKEKDNKALEKFVTETLRINTADTEYKAIYINGDTTLSDPHKKIMLTEEVFQNLMFNVEDV